MSSTSGKIALAAITVTASILLALTISVTFNYYYYNTYITQQFTNIYNQLAQIQEQVSNPPPIIVNITQGNQTTNQSEPQPTPGPKPVCKTDEVYDPSSNECVAKPVPIPNKPPVVTIDSPIKCIVGQDCSMTAKITDTDGQVTAVIWNQESGQAVGFDVSDDKWVATFKPTVGGQYIFSVEAQDNKGAATLKAITVNVPVVTPPTPTPTPVPSKDFTFTVVGDIEAGSAGTAVYDQIKKQNATYDFVLGDLGYANDISWFKQTYGSLGDKMFCVVGNHESANEDGTASLQKATQEYCGDSYWIKEGSTLFMLFNTNGDLKTQGSIAGKLLQNTTFMNGVKNLHILSHKPCAAPPNSHHPVESSVKTFCDTLKAKIPSNIKTDYIQAHNHVMSASQDGTYKQVGSGGRSHYTCGTNTVFPFCDNVHYGFLKVTVKADGTTTTKFIDSKGSEVTGIK